MKAKPGGDMPPHAAEFSGLLAYRLPHDFPLDVFPGERLVSDRSWLSSFARHKEKPPVKCVVANITVPCIFIERSVEQAHIETSSVIVIPKNRSRERFCAGSINYFAKGISCRFEVLKAEELAISQHIRKQNLMVLGCANACAYFFLLAWRKSAFRFEDSLGQVRYRKNGTLYGFADGSPLRNWVMRVKFFMYGCEVISLHLAEHFDAESLWLRIDNLVMFRTKDDEIAVRISLILAQGFFSPGPLAAVGYDMCEFCDHSAVFEG